MTVMENTIEYIQEIVGDKWIVKFENERLTIAVEDTTESRLDPQQLERIQRMGFVFESILVTSEITAIFFVPNGGLIIG